MKQYFKYDNIAGGSYRELVDVTRSKAVSYYLPDSEASQEGFDLTVTDLLGNDTFSKG